MAAARNTLVLVTLAEEASWLREAIVPMERPASRAAATARTATAPRTATVLQVRCLEAAGQVPVRPTAVATWESAAAAAAVAPAAAGCPVQALAGSATTAVPSSRHRTPSSAVNAAWRAARDVTWPPGATPCPPLRHEYNSTTLPVSLTDSHCHWLHVGLAVIRTEMPPGTTKSQPLHVLRQLC